MADSQITFKTLLDNSKLNSGIFESGTAFKGLNQAVDASNASIGQLVKTQANLLSTLSGAGAGLKEQASTVVNIKESYGTAKTALEAYKKVLDDSVGQYNASKTALDGIKKALSDQKEELRQNQTALSLSKTTYEQLKKALGDTASETQQAKANYESLNNAVEGNKTAISGLKQEYSSMSKSVQANKAELAGIQSEYTSQAGAVEKLKSSLESAEQAYDKSVDGLEEMKKALIDTTKQMSSTAWEGFKKSLEQVGNVAVSTGKALANGLKVGIDISLSAVKTVSAVMGGLGAIGLKYNSEMENYLINFSTLLGSQEEAVKKVDQLKIMASKTPFGMADLAQATETLLGFGVETDKTMGIIQNIGDISLGSTEKMSRLTLAFAQMHATGKLAGDELNQMVESGFNPLQEISRQTGVSMKDLKEAMSDGAISADMVTVAFQTATQAGGMFYNGMENASQSVTGLISTIKDDFVDLVGNVFTPISEQLVSGLLPMVQGYITQLADALAVDGLQGLITALGTVLADMATYIASQVPIFIDIVVQVIDSMAIGLSDNAPTLATALVEGLTSAIGGIIPVLADLGVTMINALFAGIGSAVPELEGMLLPLQEAFNNIAESGIIENLVDLFGQLGRKAIEVAPHVAKMFDKGLEVIINTVSTAIKLLADNIDVLIPFVAGLTSAMIAYKATLIIASLIEGLKTAMAGLKTVIDGTIIAQLALNSAMKANVIILIVSLIIGLVTALIYLWKTNEDFRVGFMTAWAMILNFFEGVPLFFKKVGYGILDGFSYAKVNVLNVMQSMLNGIIDIVNIGLKALSALTDGAIKPLEYASFATESAVKEAETRASRSKELAGESLALAEKADKRIDKLRDSARDKGKTAGTELGTQINETATKEVDITSILPPNTLKQAGGVAGAGFGDSLAKGMGGSKGKVKKSAKDLAKEAYEETVKGLNDRKALGDLTVEQELEQYKILQAQYKDNAEIKMDIDKAIYALEKDLSKKSYDSTMKEIENKKFFGKLTLEQELEQYEKLAVLYESDADKKLELDKKVHTLKAELLKQQEEEMNKFGEATTEALKRQKKDEVDTAKEAIQAQIDLLSDLEYEEITVAENVKETKIKLYDEETRKKISGIDEGLDKFLDSSDKEIQKRIDIIALTDAETASKLQQIKDEESAIKTLAETEKTAIREKQEMERQRKLEQAVATAEPEKQAEAQKALNDYLEELQQKQKERQREQRLKELEEDKRLTLESAKTKIEEETKLILDLTKQQTEQVNEVKKSLQTGDPSKTGVESLKSLEDGYKEFEKTAEKSAILLIKSGEDGQRKALETIQTFYPEWEDKGKNFVQKMADGVSSNAGVLEKAYKALPKPEIAESGTVEAVTEEVINNAPKLEEPAEAIITNLIEYMKLQFIKFKDFSASMFSEIRIYVNNMKWSDIGKDIIMAMVNGVVENQQKLVDAVKSAVESAQAVAVTPVTQVTAPPTPSKFAVPAVQAEELLNVRARTEIPLNFSTGGAVTNNNSNVSSSTNTTNNYNITQENTLNGAKMSRLEFRDFVRQISEEMTTIGV